MALAIISQEMTAQLHAGRNSNTPVLSVSFLSFLIVCTLGGANCMRKKKKYLLLFLLLLLIIVIVVLCLWLFNPDNKNNLPIDNDAVTWEGEKELQHKKSSDNKIAIPCFDSLVFTANQTEQPVNFYNPKENSCLFQMSLYVDNNLLWQSGYVQPGDGYYTITLGESLDAGEYSGYLMINCFLADGTELNSAKVNFTLISQEES